MIYDLIVCWDDGNKDTFTFTSEEAAKIAEAGFKNAFGGQVIFTCINIRRTHNKKVCYALVLCMADGTKRKISFRTEESAKIAEMKFKEVFKDQIKYTYIEISFIVF